MDFANERYVRLYTTESVNFLLLPWQSRVLLRAIAPYFDRAGVFPLSACDPAKGVAVKLRCPENFVAIALPPLLRGGTGPLRLYQDRQNGEYSLFWPNFMAAQNAKQSDAQRARASREKRRNEINAAKIVPNWKSESQNVTTTERDAESQNVTGNTGGPETRDTFCEPDETVCDAGITERTKTSLCTRDRDRDQKKGSQDEPAPGPKKTLGKTKKGTRIPDDFELTPELYAWAREAPDVRFDRKHVDNYTAEFIDYWRGVSGQRAVKLDWIATWRNRLRAKREYKPDLPEPAPEMGPPPKGPPPMDPAVAARAAEIREEMAQGKKFDLQAVLADIGRGPAEQAKEGS